jgi:hypothetical protein
VTTLNIIMVNVLRFRGGGDLSGLIDPPAGKTAGSGPGASGGGARIIPVQPVPVLVPGGGEEREPAEAGAEGPRAVCNGCG